jgi:ryanodine receptor 2
MLVLIIFCFFSCRFVFGGDHGKFKFGVPEGHSPAIESLFPKENLKLDQCFWFGDVQRNLICGPTEVDYVPYVPHPVETSNVSLSSIIFSKLGPVFKYTDSIV